jgi:aspartyl-tRNA(Asn)/glutamyl-tRNA(Gln) amidotransferase subunit A
MNSSNLLLQFTLAEAAELLREQKLSSVALTQACLTQLEKLNPKLNAFITVMSESALATATKADNEIRNGRYRGPLHGIPIGLKDLVDTAGVKTTCGSAVFADRIPETDAEIVTRLRAAGAVLIGKQNMQEFAYGGTSAASHFGPVRNPWDITRIPGGSSGGSAAAVAAGMCFASIGTDTGGSVRQPASYCGVVGLKPTYGRISTRGVFPLSWSLDHVGPLCRTVTDTALLMEVIAGYDLLDPTTVDRPVEEYSKALRSTVKLRCGLVRNPFFEDLDIDVAAAIENAVLVIENLGHKILEVDLPTFPTTVQAPEVYAVHEATLHRSPELFQPWVRERLVQAEKISTTEYVNGRRELDRVRREIEEVFEHVDVLLTPTVSVPPIEVDEAMKMSPPVAGEVWLRNTRPFNAYGLPTISVPCGLTSNRLPIGLQIAGPHFQEAKVLAFAYGFEQATEWHKLTPPILEGIQ